MPLIPFIPSTPASTHPGRFRDAPASTSLLGLGGAAGGPFLPDVFGVAGRQVLLAAFGANLDDDPAQWVWTDVTRPYVQWDPGVAIQIGSGGRSARRIIASQLTAVLRNDQAGGGDWTIGNQLGRWRGQLKENVPIRAQVDVGNGEVDRFFGYLTSAAPKRGPAGESFVALTAHGISRRIARGKSAPFSALRKSIDRALPSAYWSLEKGTGGSVGASAVAGAPDMHVTSGVVAFGQADDSLPSSLPLAQLTKDGTAGQLSGAVPVAPPAGPGGRAWSFEMVLKSPTQQPGALVNIVDWFVTGTIDHWNISLQPAAEGGIAIAYVNSVGGLGYHASGVSGDDGEWHHIRVDVAQSGGNVIAVMYVDGDQATTDTIPCTNGPITSVLVNTTLDSDDFDGIGVGHIALWNTGRPNAEDTYAAFTGHTGETVAERLARLADEAGVAIEIVGDADDLMGPQRAAAFLDVVQDAVDVDGGVLVDGLGPGLTYYTRQSGYDRAPALTLDVGDDIPQSLPGDHTDAGRVNRFVATDPLTNASRTYEDSTGPMGTNGSTGVGVYEDGDAFRVNIPDQLDQIAAWRVGQGTVPGLRWPQLAFQLAKPITAAKAQQWLDVRPLYRIDALGLTSGSEPDRSLSVRGWRERWNSLTWDVTVLTEPYDSYEVTMLAADTGSDGEFIGWLEVDTVVTRDPLLAGGTSVVAIVTGTSLTNPTVASYADDLDGLYIDLDGLKVGVTAITAPSGGQQTLSLTGADVLRDVPAGASISAWDPVRPGL